MTTTICIALKFLSTLSLRRATNVRPEIPQRDAISIHALLAESDSQGSRAGICKQIISIHALLAESDGTLLTLITEFLGFLSTLSLRRATGW